MDDISDIKDPQNIKKVYLCILFEILILKRKEIEMKGWFFEGRNSIRVGRGIKKKHMYIVPTHLD